MAANFWDSTQYRFWQFTKEQLAEARQRLEDGDPGLTNMFPLPDQRDLSIYFNTQINRLAKRLGVRQQAIATAQSYIKRFYLRVELRRTNPYLVMATSLYLASKTEECPQHIRLVAAESRHLWNDLLTVDTSRIAECEFWLISEMCSQMIIHQPYRTLTSLQGELNLSQEELKVAWDVINDHYMTDLPLLFPPHIIALTGISLAFAPGAIAASASQGSGSGGNNLAANEPRSNAPFGQSPANASISAQSKDPAQREDSAAKADRFATWLAESTVNIESIVECTQEMISFYQCQEQHNDKLTREQVNRFIKAKGLDK